MKLTTAFGLGYMWFALFSYACVVEVEGENPSQNPTDAEEPVDEPESNQTIEPNEPGQPAYLTETWVRTGGPPAGIGYDIRMRPDNLDVMYVTDDGAGAFRSVDSGQTWSPINNGITTRTGVAGDGYSVFCLTIDPNNHDRVWIGTSGNSGVFRSDDGGESWTEMTDGIQEQFVTFRGISIEPGNSDVVYVSGEVSSFEWNGVEEPGSNNLDRVRGVIYKSEDGGVSWRRLWTGDNLVRYVLIDPDNPDRLFASTGIFDRSAANCDHEAGDPGGVGILRSLDSGESWEVLDERNGLGRYELVFGSLAMHPENSDILLAGAGLDSFPQMRYDNGGVYLTEDGGDTWTEVLTGGIFSSVEFCEGNPDVVYAGAINGIWRSLDGGHTWESRQGELWGSDDMAAGFPIDMQCDPRDPQRVFVNNYVGGNFLSLDGGLTWILSSDGYTGAKIGDIAISRSDPSRVYVTARTGIFTTANGGANWEGLNYGVARPLEGWGVSVDPRNDNHLFTIQQDAGPNPLESFDGGMSWQVVDTGIVGIEDEVGGVIDVIFSPQDTQTLFGLVDTDFSCWHPMDLFECGNGDESGLIISRDGGASWSFSNLEGGHVTSLEVAEQNGGPVYASVYEEGIYRSDDHGRTWSLVSAAPIVASLGEVRHWATLAIDPNDPEHLYAGLGRGGIATSQDGGRSWTISSVGLPPDIGIADLEVDPNNHGVVYAASPGPGMFYSTDSGALWMNHSDGLTNRAAMRLALSTDGSVLYLGSQGGGVFRLGAIE